MPKQPYEQIDLKALRCFEMMARHGSLTRAGIELGISDAAVSQRIKALETYLGAKLYEARGGRVRLTDAGQRTRDLATRLFDELADFEAGIGDEDSRRTIVLAAEAPLLRYQLPDVVDGYARPHRGVRLRLLSRTSTETIDLVRRNEIDLGVIHERTLPSGVRFHRWRTFKAYVLIPRGHPLARRRVPRLDDLLNEETLIAYPQVVAEVDEHDRNRLREGLERLGLPYNVALEAGDLETVKIYVARGHGLAVVPGMCLSSEDASLFHLIEVPETFGGETAYGVILREDKHISPSLRDLLALFEVADIGP